MTSKILGTQTIEQLAEAVTVSQDAWTAIQEPGGKMNKLKLERLLGKLISTNAAKTTRALLLADLAFVENSIALVFADPTPALNGWYRKTGASGAGTWTQFEKLGAQALAEVNAVIAQAEAARDVAINNATTALLAYAQHEAAKYGIILGSNLGAIWDFKYWRTDCYQDDGITRCTAAGQPFGLIKNRLGIPSLDALAMGICTLDQFMDIYFATGGPGTGLRLRGNQSLVIPHFLLSVQRFDSNSVNAHFGLVKADGSHFFIASDSHRARTPILGVSPSRAWTIPTTEPYSRPPKTFSVFHALASAGSVSSRVNDGPDDPLYSPKNTTWQDGDVVTNMSGGVNISSQSSAGGGTPVADGTKGWAWGGGAFLPDARDFDRARIAKYFMDATDPEIRPQDILIIAPFDSQADDVDRTVGDYGAHPAQPGPIPLWILKHLGPDNPTASILYRKASWKGDFLTGWRAEQIGSGDARIFVISLSVAGSQPNFFLGDKFDKFIGSLPHVSHVIVGQGGNMGHSVADPDGIMKQGEYKELVDAIWAVHPDAQIGFLGPYKFHNSIPDTQAGPNKSCLRAAARYNIAVLETYPAWGVDLSLYFTDKAHLSYGVGPTFGIDKRADEIDVLFTAMLAAGNARGQSSLGFTTSNGIANGRLIDFDVGGLPTGMTAHGTVTVTRSTVRADVDGGRHVGVRLKQAAGLGYVRWSLAGAALAPFLGKTVTATVALTQSGRGAGAHFSENVLKMSSNGTGAADPNSWLCASSGQGGGRKRYIRLSRPIAADATSFTADLICADGGAGDITLHWISLVEGEDGKIPL